MFDAASIEQLILNLSPAPENIPVSTNNEAAGISDIMSQQENQQSTRRKFFMPSSQNMNQEAGETKYSVFACM